mgnify:CR=1 FL=1
MTEGKGPLAGIRIVEIDAIGPVPLAAMLLAATSPIVAVQSRTSTSRMTGIARCCST